MWSGVALFLPPVSAMDMETRRVLSKRLGRAEMGLQFARAMRACTPEPSLRGGGMATETAVLTESGAQEALVLVVERGGCGGLPLYL
ncbi:hypothetical protein DRW03_35595 [Corallococcus sp. H22C18031201]|nr:hypothetical protein DRW03_35595 [Corallococcus sp. H22C18031201]